MNKDRINEVLAQDRGAIVAELRRAEQELADQSCGEVTSTICDDLIRECNVLTGALEIYDGTQELDLISHPLTGSLVYSSGDNTPDGSTPPISSPLD